MMTNLEAITQQRDEARQAARDAQAEVVRLEGLLLNLQKRAEDAK